MRLKEAIQARIMAVTAIEPRMDERSAGCIDTGTTVFAHACKLGLESIVSKRRDAPYQHGRSRAWLKIKNQASPAAKRIEDGTF